MKKSLLTGLAVLLAFVSAVAQRIEVVDADGHGIPMVSVLTEDGNIIGSTDLNGVLDDVKGAKKVALTHVAYKPQMVSVNTSTANGRQSMAITMEDLDYSLSEIVVKPKPYIYVETLYRVYVYRNDSLCYFLSGIMPNIYDPKKKKTDHGSYYQAKSEFCEKMGAAITWSVRAERLGAGRVNAKGLEELEKKLKKDYFVSTTAESPTRRIYNNPQGKVGQLVRSGDQTRMTIDAGKSQMYANAAKGQTRLLKMRENKNYEYQFTLIWANRLAEDETAGLSKDDESTNVANFIMELNHWEYNDKKGHVKFFIENYATDHYYMDKDEWKAKKKTIKTDYGSSMTLDQILSYEQQHNIPALSSATRQAIGKLKKEW